jgi:hypothetical protein
MTYFNELAKAGYHDMTGCPVHSQQPHGLVLVLADTIGSPAGLYERGTYYQSGRLRSLVLECGSVLIAGLHGPAGNLDRRTLDRLAPQGRAVFHLLPGLARGDLVIPEAVLISRKPLSPPASPPAWQERPYSLDWHLNQQTPILPALTYIVDGPQPRRPPVKLPRRRVKARRPPAEQPQPSPLPTPPRPSQ